MCYHSSIRPPPSSKFGRFWEISVNIFVFLVCACLPQPSQHKKLKFLPLSERKNTANRYIKNFIDRRLVMRRGRRAFPQPCTCSPPASIVQIRSRHEIRPHEFLSAALCNNAVLNEISPVAQRLGAAHVVSNGYHCIARLAWKRKTAADMRSNTNRVARCPP